MMRFFGCLRRPTTPTPVPQEKYPMISANDAIDSALAKLERTNAKVEALDEKMRLLNQQQEEPKAPSILRKLFCCGYK